MASESNYVSVRKRVVGKSQKCIWEAQGDSVAFSERSSPQTPKLYSLETAFDGQSSQERGGFNIAKIYTFRFPAKWQQKKVENKKAQVTYETQHKPVCPAALGIGMKRLL